MAEVILKDEITFYCSRCEKEIDADQKHTGKNKGIYVERCESCLQEDDDTKNVLIHKILELEEELKDLKEA